MQNDLAHRVADALRRAGFGDEVPADDAFLGHAGVDSLMQALWIVELESMFKLRFSVKDMESDAFQTIQGVAALLKAKGAA